MDFSTWMAQIQQRTESALAKRLPAADRVPRRLHDAMRYSSLGGGKRIRPLLCHAAGIAAGANPEALDAPACAVEFIHVYSLVHDDLPSMDNDVLRRGKPTCHIEFDEATALLVGDALQALAFESIAEPIAGVNAARQLDMLRTLAMAAGSRGMAGGQAIDLAAIATNLNLAELEYMHIHKTGALIRAAVMLGAQCANASPQVLDSLSGFANRAGLLFQVIDDILDAEADTTTLGKTAGKDRTDKKPTFYSLLGAHEAKQFALRLREEALQALLPLGESTLRLQQITDYIAARHF